MQWSVRKQKKSDPIHFLTLRFLQNKRGWGGGIPLEEGDIRQDFE